jgi:hypothetical protein
MNRQPFKRRRSMENPPHSNELPWHHTDIVTSVHSTYCQSSLRDHWSSTSKKTKWPFWTRSSQSGLLADSGEIFSSYFTKWMNSQAGSIQLKQRMLRFFRASFSKSDFRDHVSADMEDHHLVMGSPLNFELITALMEDPQVRYLSSH